MKRSITLLFGLTISLSLYAQEEGKTFPLYPGSIPDNKAGIELKQNLRNPDEGVYDHISQPTLTVYTPSPDVKNTGYGVVICPGGGYGCVCYGWEGRRTAEAFAKAGITSFILRYRLPDDTIEKDRKIAPLQDAQAALIYARENAARYDVCPEKIGIMGFSAGGHLASTAGTHYQKCYAPNPHGTSVRPDYMILVYPVITMRSDLTHQGTHDNLIGPDPSADVINLFSNEKQVTSDTPPTFLIVANDDKVVPVQNSILFYLAMLKNRRPVELHIYESGDHGFALQPSLDEWTGRVIRWILSR